MENTFVYSFFTVPFKLLFGLGLALTLNQAFRFSRVLRQRRQSAAGLTRLLQQLIGLEAKINQYEQGERFIEAVEAVGGPELLNRAFERPENLPTLAEIREPADWLRRVGRPAA